MKTKNILKLIVMIALALLIVSYATTSFAKIDPTSLVPKPTPTGPTELQGPISKLIGGIQAFGAIVAVVVLIIIGILYITAAPEGKMQLKGKLLPYMIGAVLLFATTTVVTIIYNAFN
jgi:type IV secretory pathway VirB2 component (pilin)